MSLLASGPTEVIGLLRQSMACHALLLSSMQTLETKAGNVKQTVMFPLCFKCDPLFQERTQGEELSFSFPHQDLLKSPVESGEGARLLHSKDQNSKDRELLC